ncbi:MAG: hypothetical protein ACKO0W_12735, partial [Planctomycetota bacterium]
LAAAWIFLAWIIIFGCKPPVQPHAASYADGLQLLFAMIAVGTSVLWPLLRLSGRPSSAPILQALFDAFAILVLLQVVVWPLRLVSNWTIERSIAIDCALAAALFTTAAILGIAQGKHGSRPRTIAMAVVVVLASIPPLIERAGSADDAFLPFAALSGPLLLGRLAEPNPLDPSAAEWALLKAAAALVGAAWASVVVLRWAKGPAGARPRGLV